MSTVTSGVSAAERRLAMGAEYYSQAGSGIPYSGVTTPEQFQAVIDRRERELSQPKVVWVEKELERRPGESPGLVPELRESGSTMRYARKVPRTEDDLTELRTEIATLRRLQALAQTAEAEGLVGLAYMQPDFYELVDRHDLTANVVSDLIAADRLEGDASGMPDRHEWLKRRGSNAGSVIDFLPSASAGVGVTVGGGRSWRL